MANGLVYRKQGFGTHALSRSPGVGMYTYNLRQSSQTGSPTRAHKQYTRAHKQYTLPHTLITYNTRYILTHEHT